MGQKDRLWIFLGSDATAGPWTKGDWVAFFMIYCDSVQSLMRDQGFLWRPADYIDTKRRYVTTDAKATRIPSSLGGNHYTHHYIMPLVGPRVKKTTMTPSVSKEPEKRCGLFRFGGKKKDVPVVGEEEIEIYEPEWAGTLYISAKSYGALSRSGFEEWTHKNIYMATGCRRDEGGKMRVVYNYAYVGDHNINCIYGPKRALTGFWPWPREEHVRGDVSGARVSPAMEGERKEANTDAESKEGERDEPGVVGVADRPY
ncbi:hypothetical protein V8F20_004973 [Naviculisporaceae sp. PSN 640]